MKPNRGRITTHCKKELTLKGIPHPFMDSIWCLGVSFRSRPHCHCDSKLTSSSVMKMEFDMDDIPLIQLQDDGLSANECYPQMLVNDPTFALLNNDNYFARNGRAAGNWVNPPTAAQTGGNTPPFGKRSEDHLAWDDGNSSRPLTDVELNRIHEYMRWVTEQEQEHEALGYVKCFGEDCATETIPLTRYV